MLELIEVLLMVELPWPRLSLFSTNHSTVVVEIQPKKGDTAV